MSQSRRVRRALERHAQGVCSVDFLLPNVIDGGLPITRLAARINDLRKAGVEIEVDGERHGCAVYKLAQTPQRVQVTPVGRRQPMPTPPAVPESPAEPLFELVPQPRPGMYDDPDLAA